MKKILLLLSLLLGFSVVPAMAEEKIETKELETVKRDGLSYETAIIMTQSNESAGVAAEYEWIRKNYVSSKVQSQKLVKNKKTYDIITIKTQEGLEKDIYFDISNFFGKF